MHVKAFLDPVLSFKGHSVDKIGLGLVLLVFLDLLLSLGICVSRLFLFFRLLGHLLDFSLSSPVGPLGLAAKHRSPAGRVFSCD